MRILPILFNTEMTGSILHGKKGCTRRLVKPQQFVGMLPDKCKNALPDEFLKEKHMMFKPYCDMTDSELISTAYNSPYQPGDILYVRETWQCWRAHRYEATADIRFRAGGDDVRLQFANGYTDSIDRYAFDTFVHKWFSHNGEWKPSLFMPKEAARIWLRVTNVRVERLQDITSQGAWKEGARCACLSPVPDCAGNKTAFIEIWNSTIQKSDLDRYGWDANPWVWVIEFERCEKPEVN